MCSQLAPQPVARWEVVEPLRGGPGEGSEIVRECAVQGDVGTQRLSHLLPDCLR